jgi:hypothetical protein
MSQGRLFPAKTGSKAEKVTSTNAIALGHKDRN